MRIYIDNLKIPNIETNVLKFDQTKRIEYQNIYSSEGIFRIQNNNIIKLIPKDSPIKKINYNNITFLIDKSKYEVIKNIYNIPFNHMLYNIKQIEYKLYNKSKITLIVEYNQAYQNIYFSTNEENLDTILKDNILEYLSLINYNKQS
jgi:hypothetical protein